MWTVVSCFEGLDKVREEGYSVDSQHVIVMFSFPYKMKTRKSTLKTCLPRLLYKVHNCMHWNIGYLCLLLNLVEIFIFLLDICWSQLFLLHSNKFKIQKINLHWISLKDSLVVGCDVGGWSNQLHCHSKNELCWIWLWQLYVNS